MPKWVRDILLTPRLWLATGAFCIGASFIVGYYADQKAAQIELQKKVGMPEEVLLQDFVTESHTNLINQLHVIGEIHADEGRLVNLGSEDAPHYVSVVPVYAAGSEALPIARQIMRQSEGTPRRPKARADAPEVALSEQAIERIQHLALAFSVTHLGDNAEAPVHPTPMTVLAEGIGHQLVSLNGSMVSGHALQSRLSQVLALDGVKSTPDTLLVEPIAAAPALASLVEDIQPLRGWLTILGIALTMIGAAAPIFVDAVPRRPSRPSEVETVAAASAFPAVSFFQPIATQAELAEEDKASKAMKRSGPSRVFETILRQIAGRTNGAEPLRSPR